jgi:hypothetical protein
MQRLVVDLEHLTAELHGLANPNERGSAFDRPQDRRRSDRRKD